MAVAVDIATLGLAVDSTQVTRGAAALDGLARSGAKAEDAARKVTTATQQMNSDLQRASQNFNNVIAFIKGFISIGLAQHIIGIADSWTLMDARIRLATKNTEQAALVQERLFDIAQRTRQGMEGVVELYTRTARSMAQIGASQSEVLKFTEGVSKALIVSGAAAGEAASGVIQLGQALGSGRLAGDELRAVLENMPRIAKAIADGLGVSVGQLRALASEGKLTSESVFRAFLSQIDTINKEFDHIPTTVGQAFTVMSNSFGRYINEANKGLSVTKALADLILLAANNMRLLVEVTITAIAIFAAWRAVAIVTALAAAIRSSTIAMAALNAVMRANPIGLFAAGLAALIGVLLIYNSAQKETTKASDETIASLEEQTELKKTQTSEQQKAIQALQDEARYLELLIEAQHRGAEAVGLVELAYKTLKRARELNLQPGTEEYDQLVSLTRANYDLQKSLEATKATYERSAQARVKAAELTREANKAQFERDKTDGKITQEQQIDLARIERRIELEKQSTVVWDEVAGTYKKVNRELAIYNDLERVRDQRGGYLKPEDYAAAEAKVDAEKRYQDAVEQSNRAVQRQQNIVSEFSDFGERAFDNVGQSITNAFVSGQGAAVTFGNIALGVVSELAQEFVKLAAINPLKNAIFGQNNATFGDIIGKFFGGGDGVSNYFGSTQSYSSIGSAALPFGGPRASGGPVQPGMSYAVGERGMERFVPNTPGTIVPAGGGDVYVDIQLVNQSSQPLQASQSQAQRGPDGRTLVKLMVKDVLPEILSSGSMDKHLGRNFNIARQPIPR